MALYQVAKDANILISPGPFFRFEGGPAAADAWMRVNVSRCESDVLSRVLRVLAAAV